MPLEPAGATGYFARLFTNGRKLVIKVMKYGFSCSISKKSRILVSVPRKQKAVRK